MFKRWMEHGANRDSEKAGEGVPWFTGVYCGRLVLARYTGKWTHENQTEFFSLNFPFHPTVFGSRSMSVLAVLLNGFEVDGGKVSSG